ncbi:DnaJ-class molecular chaperone with C-terminal Zn finger domain [Synechococcus sp. PCC 7502]|uniref:tetratricopeptide repeat protein n=1 Tax=Synechococcus sp. PCC 7502 TaxID=1173263 RepID=UPI00029FFF60|nr:tetratricopeptide repeat protein [Synechococcus sp. PCC 7502]AFY73990.1 DnaJ-class molecular chaperone with C-terminal Zn finger domain [Synechococcus sp. PCC 7502]
MFKQIRLFKINRGLYTHKVTDHYAVLGLPLTTTDSETFRNKYLQLAKQLHPDLAPPNSPDTEIAEKYLAKLVNPAYKVLYSDRDRKEHLATLRLLGQRLKLKGEQPELHCELAKKLLKYSHEQTYVKYFEEIASRQYESLDQVLDRIADLSELNLVYVMTQELSFIDDYVNIPQPEPEAPKVSPAYRNLQLAELFISKRQWAEALKELKNGEKLDPNNANLQAQLGFVYMNQNITLMAKNSFQKALKLDPKEPTALKYIKQVSGTTQPAKKDEKKGGFFGWGKK